MDPDGRLGNHPAIVSGEYFVNGKAANAMQAYVRPVVFMRSSDGFLFHMRPDQFSSGRRPDETTKPVKCTRNKFGSTI